MGRDLGVTRATLERCQRHHVNWAQRADEHLVRPDRLYYRRPRALGLAFLALRRASGGGLQTARYSTVATQQAPRSILGTAVQVVFLLLLLSVLAGMLVVLFAVLSLLNTPGRLAGDLGSRLSGVTSEAERAVSGAQQALQNVTDPNRPPTGLVYDNEFASLQVVRVGERMPDGSSQYTLTVQAIRRREGADSPNTALYVVVHAELRQPRETRLLGQVIRSDSDPHDHVVYKGETFRVGGALYRVNWISLEDSTLAVGRYRHPDEVSAPLKFQYD